MTTPKKMLVTSALPYANGSIHLGHLVEYIQTDIWVRFQKLIGNDCIYVCADDAHGTPIMIAAEKAGITPEQLIEKFSTEHQQDFADFYIGFDHYYSTHSDENKAIATTIYQRLKENGDIVSRTIEQAFDPEKNMFLPDRYVKGECPRCHAGDQYGDNCEVCGSTYLPTELINPKSVVSGTTPIQKKSEHYFFKLKNYQPFLQQWVSSGHLQPQVTNKLKEWFSIGLQDWDISRDEPYFGFEIPDAPGKYFYVWLDAPVGYMASFKHFCDQSEINFDKYWNNNSTTELHHFIGKDIVYFHGLFWPAMLKGSQFRTPTAIYAHGYLTVNGKKMSKSRGTFITARDYLKQLDPEYLRYYFAAKLNSGVEDIDLNFDDFTQRVNSDLVGKVVNIASRCAGFITKKFNGKLAAKIADDTLFKHFINAGDNIADLYQQREYAQAMREIMALADKANQYIDEHKPWILAKEDLQQKQVQAICSMGINLFKIIITYLKPVLPNLAKNTETFLNTPPLTWNNRHQPLLNHSINKFKPLMLRVDPDKLKTLQI